MKFILLLAVLYLVHAEESKNDKPQSFQVVLVDTKSSESDNSDQKQSKRSLYGGPAFAGSGAGIALSFPDEPIAAPGPGLFVGGASGPGLYAASASGPGIYAGPASGPGLFAGPAPVAGIAPGPVAAIAAPGPAPGLYTEANVADPAAYGSGYAPTFASFSAPAGPHVHCSSPTGPHVQCSPPHVHLGEQLVSQRIEITRPVPYPVYKTVAVAVPHPVPYPVPQPVAVKVPHPVPVEVPVAYPVVKHVPYAVERPVPFPVDKPYPVKIYKKIPVPVPKPYPVHIPILIKKHIHHHDSHFSKGWD